MKKELFIILIILFILLFGRTLIAQVTFEKSFKSYASTTSDEGDAVIQTSDGGYIVAGGSVPQGGSDMGIYLVKTNVNGDTLWTRIYSPAGYALGIRVHELSGGGYCIAGISSSSSTGNDFLLMKTDANGNLLWMKSYGGTGYETLRDMVITADGGYAMIGSTNSFGAGGDDIYFIKTDSNGDTLWTEAYGTPADEEAFSLLQTADGGYAFTGKVTSGTGNTDICFVKTNASGNITWSMNYGTTDEEYGTSVIETSNGYMLSGARNIYTSGVLGTIFLINTDVNGNPLWAKTIDYNMSGSGINNTVLHAVSGGGYIIGATTFCLCPSGYSTLILTKTDAGANVLFQTSYSQGVAVIQSSDGGYVIAGKRMQPDPDLYLVKTDANGNTLCNTVATGITSNTWSVTTSNGSMNFSSAAAVVAGLSPNTGSGAIENILCAFSSGIERYETGSVLPTVIPNPFSTSSVLKLSLSNPGKITVIIYDMTGRKVASIISTDACIKIERGSLCPGMYNYRVVRENEHIASGKFVIE